MQDENKQLAVAELAALVGGRVTAGDGGALIERVASLESAGAGACSFVEDEKFLEGARASRASCLLVPEGTGAAAGEFAATLVEVARPKLAFALVAEVLHPQRRRAGGIHPTAVVAESARIAEDVFIGAGVSVGERVELGRGTQVLAGAVLEDDVEVGSECVIHPNVVLYAGARIGSRVVLHAGVVVGADGFGYVRGAEGYHKFPQVGAVVIEDDVEIGANSCVDRGADGNIGQHRHRVGRGNRRAGGDGRSCARGGGRDYRFEGRCLAGEDRARGRGRVGRARAPARRVQASERTLRQAPADARGD